MKGRDTFFRASGEIQESQSQYKLVTAPSSTDMVKVNSSIDRLETYAEDEDDTNIMVVTPKPMEASIVPKDPNDDYLQNPFNENMENPNNQFTSPGEATGPVPNQNTNYISDYIFIKPFLTHVAIGGFLGVKLYSRKVGDVIRGIVVDDKNGGEQKLKVEINENPIQGAQSHLYIPMSYLSDNLEDNPNKRLEIEEINSSNTNPKKKTWGLLIGVIVVGAILIVASQMNKSKAS